MLKRTVACLAISVLVAAGCGGGGSTKSVCVKNPYLPSCVNQIQVQDTTPPTLSIASPATGTYVADSVFWADSFQITLSYSDASDMDMTSLSVAFKMDSGAANNITQYFLSKKITLL